MKTKRVHCLAAALVLPLLLVVGCDTGGGVIGDDLPREQAYRIDCFVPDGATQMLFEAHGALQDEGTVEGEESANGVIYRVFVGEKGTMAVRVEATPGYGAHLTEGTFKVLGSSGVYALAEREGDFYTALDERGELVEVFEGRSGDGQ